MQKNTLLGILFSLVAIQILAQDKSERPNVLFIMFDDAGLDMSAYGSSYVSTPGFDAIAQEGILFTRAYTPNAKCAPSRAAVITGRNPWQLDAAANHQVYFPTKFKSYQEVLLANGYTTGHTGKGYGPAIVLNDDGTARPIMGPAYNDKKVQPPTPFIGPNDYSGNFTDFLEKAPTNKPWSFWVGSVEPHRAYEYGSGVRLGGKNTAMITDFPSYWPDNEVTRNDLLDYAYEIEYMDKHVQKIIQKLREKDALKNTLIILTSDHGMPFPRVKGNQYEQANHIPMAIMWEGKLVSKGRKIDDFVSFIDLAPTILEATGIDWKSSGMHPPAGKSMMNIITSAESGQIDASRNYILVGKERHDNGRPNDVGYPIRGIYKDSMLYLKNYETDRWPSGNPETGYLNSDGSPTKTEILDMRRSGANNYFWKLNFGKRTSEELYNIKSDPYCIQNLAEDSYFNTLKEALKLMMGSILTNQNDLRMKGYGHLYEQYPLANGKGFYEAFMTGAKPSAGWVNESDFEEYYLDAEGNALEKVIKAERQKD